MSVRFFKNLSLRHSSSLPSLHVGSNFSVRDLLKPQNQIAIFSSCFDLCSPTLNFPISRSIQLDHKWRMLDHSEKVDFEAVERSRAGEMIEQNKKTCVNCGTSKTPLWRGGPLGPKSLCNACGIRNRKKRRGGDDKKPKRSSSSDLKRNSLKQRMMDLGITQRSMVEKQLMKLGEEEQAAVLLMALSYGSVYA